MTQRTHTFNPLWTKFLALGMVGAVAASCGSSSDTPSGKKKTKKAPDTFLTEQRVENGMATFKYNSDDSSASFKCRTLVNGQPTSDWQSCPSGTLTVAMPTSGAMTFEVKAISASGIEDPIPYSVPVNGSGSPTQSASFVQNAQALDNQTIAGQAKFQNISLSLAHPNANTYKASIDGQDASWLVQGNMLSLNIQQLQIPSGTHTLRVDAMNGSQTVAQQTIRFCVDQCTLGGGNGTGTAQPGFSTLMVGPYQVNVPQGMHVNEYVTKRNMYGLPNMYSLMAGQDPYYTPVQLCIGNFGGQLGATEQIGNYSYCHSTMLDDAFKATNDFRLAFNHVELATDTRSTGGIQGSLPTYENIMINVFDNQFEFMNSTSRFGQLCRGRQITTFPNVPMIAAFFMGMNPQPVTVHVCETYMQGPYGQPLPVRVGAFFSTDIVNQQNFWTCQGSCPSAPNAIEMVHVKVPDGYDVNAQYYTRRVQERVLTALSSLPIN